jgi:hypothetical protein
MNTKGCVAYMDSMSAGQATVKNSKYSKYRIESFYILKTGNLFLEILFLFDILNTADTVDA